MMQLLLCAATEFEIHPVRLFLEQHKAAFGSNVSILVTGIGLTAATYALTKAVALQRPHFLLQAGIAGALDNNLPLTKVVVIQNEMIGDLGVQEEGNFKTIFDLGFGDKNKHPFSGGKLPNKGLKALADTAITVTDGITVNEITTDQKRREYYRTVLGASVETMEGAALHYVALMENIPFLQVRSLSNFVGVRDKKEWVTEKAIAALNSHLQQILANLFNV